MTDSANDRLFAAAARGDLNAITAALADGADLEAKDAVDMTPLTLAVRGGLVQAVLFLLGRGAKVTNDTLLVASMSVNSSPTLLKVLQLAQIKQVAPEVADHSEAEAALLTAAYRGDTEAVRAALARGANPNAYDDQDTSALRWAARHGHTGAVTALLDGGADVNQRSFTGWAAIIEAVLESNEPLVRLLIERGADVNVQTFTGASVLYFARDIVQFSRNRQAAEGIIRLLEEHGAEYSEPESDDD